MKSASRILIYAGILVLFVFVVLHALGVGIQTYNIAAGVWEPAVDWAQHGALKMGIVIGRALSTAVLLVMFAMFMSNLFRSESAPFVSANSKLLFWSLLPYFIYAFCDCNLPIISGERYIQIDTNLILGAGLLLLVAVIYGRAVSLREENDLTI